MEHEKPIDEEGEEEEDELFEASSEADDDSSSEIEPDDQEEGGRAFTEGDIGNDKDRQSRVFPCIFCMRCAPLVRLAIAVLATRSSCSMIVMHQCIAQMHTYNQTHLHHTSDGNPP